MSGRRWKEHEIEFLWEIYPDEPTALIASFFGVPVKRVYNAAKHHGIKKSAAFRASEHSGAIRPGQRRGIVGEFKKGHVPTNKGLRRPGYAPGRMRETQFKPGDSLNRMPIGATRLIDGYLYRKVSDVRNVVHTVNWKLEHFLVWEKATGSKVPKGMCLAFRDRDRLNTSFENLELITRAENMRRNTIHKLPEPLKNVIRLNASLRRRIRRINEEQDVRSA